MTYIVFDVLSLDGEDLTLAPYSERRAQLEALNLDGVYWQTPETFDDGEALFDAVCAHELRGCCCETAQQSLPEGERGWVKIKNRAYWRYELERESAINRPRVKQFA